MAITRLWILHHHIDFEMDPSLVTPVHEMIDELGKRAVNFEHDLLLAALEARGLETGERKRLLKDEINDVPAGKMDTISLKRFSIDKSPGGTLGKRRQSMKVRRQSSFRRRGGLARGLTLHGCAILDACAHTENAGQDVRPAAH